MAYPAASSAIKSQVAVEFIFYKEYYNTIYNSRQHWNGI